jgi:predicted DNA-binding transcriptional regulator YafY
MRETAAARLSRLLALVPWLEQHPGISIPEAASHFGVSPEELEQDLWLTICCGLPGHGPDQLIDIQFWDDEGSINVIDAQTLDRPLRLNSGEAMSLLVGLRLLAQVPGGHDRAALASATAKLEAAADVTQGAAIVLDDPRENITAELVRAIQGRHPVQLMYAGASRDVVTERVVEPSEIVRYAGRSYLSALCRSAGALRTFRLDRILEAEGLDEVFAETDASGADAGSVAPTEGIAVRIRVEPRSRWLLEAFEATSIEALDGGAAEATLVVADPSWLVRIILGQSGGVEVLSPADVRAHARNAALAALERLPRTP